MSDRFFAYLDREHERLERLIAQEMRRPRPDDMQIRRLKKAKLLVRDQLAQWQAEARPAAAA